MITLKLKNYTLEKISCSETEPEPAARRYSISYIIKCNLRSCCLITEYVSVISYTSD